nr:fibroblast growth factor receptor substrate [Hymenolepis microstoma]
MGSTRSRLVADSFHVDDRHPILERDYNNTSDYFNDFPCQRVLCSYKARLLNDYGLQVSNGRLELTYGDLVYRYTEQNVPKLASWPLSGLRGFGGGEHLFTFEAGRRCLKSGIFVFKCKRALSLNSILSDHIARLAQLELHSMNSCICRNHDNLPTGRLTGEASQESSNITDHSTEVHHSYTASRQDRTPLPPHSTATQAIFDWPTTTTPYSRIGVVGSGQRHRWCFSDDYIYLSRTLPSPSPPGLHIHLNSGLSSSLASLPASLSGGVYLVAIPNFPSAHSYENQRTLFAAAASSS